MLPLGKKKKITILLPELISAPPLPSYIVENEVEEKGSLLRELRLISLQILCAPFIGKLSAAINCPKQSPHYQERKKGCRKTRQNYFCLFSPKTTKELHNFSHLLNGNTFISFKNCWLGFLRPVRCD